MKVVEGYGVIQTADLQDPTPTTVYTVVNGTVIPNSFDIDPAAQVIYFTSNGIVASNTRHGGGIYRMNYDGLELVDVKPMPLLNDTNYSISSLKFIDGHLYYILTGPKSASIIKYHLDNDPPTLIYNGTLFSPEQIVVVLDDDADVDIWVRDQGSFYLCDSEDCDSVTEPEFSINGYTITDFGMYFQFVIAVVSHF